MTGTSAYVSHWNTEIIFLKFQYLVETFQIGEVIVGAEQVTESYHR